ncbi:MAG: serine hydrolase [Pseudomonadales bacterium]|nr:serine hydrolase [Pseudomonadales bacterium]
MILRKLISCSLLSVCLISAGALAQEVAEDPEVQAQINLFSAWMDGQLEIRGLPGVVVGVIADQELIWAKGFGKADISADSPMELDTRFRMASIANCLRRQQLCN